ncbi:MAG: hypothetical protein MUO54_15635 [Anaerolineales bacterium]|nr:hypothetical protein [Anaerolineales bacterium]
MFRTIIGLFLIAHAVAHAGLAAAPIPNDPDSKPGAFFTEVSRSWLFQKLGLDGAITKKIGLILVILTVVGFILAGLGGLRIPGLNQIWSTAAGLSAGVSLILLILFWHPWLIMGVLIDFGLFLGLFLGKWPQ